MSFREENYAIWLSTSSNISTKAQRDLISRLRRADKLAQLDNFASLEDHKIAMCNASDWHTLPKKSQDSVLAAARKYYGWLNA